MPRYRVSFTLSASDIERVQELLNLPYSLPRGCSVRIDRLDRRRLIVGFGLLFVSVAFVASEVWRMM